MPQFIQGGPNIPEELLHALEEGQVVFFCGAGISYPAGLPTYKRLVERMYDKLHAEKTDAELKAFRSCQYDTTLHQLERRYRGGRIEMRKPLHEILEPNLRTASARQTHDALLELGRTQDGKLRLVTTNFDCIFERRMRAKKLNYPKFRAPLLPVPKRGQWNGLVYLHGLLPHKDSPNELDSLVLTSGDFGLAYLADRWASRFISELLRNFTVCFVGYSLSDPVLRYMMDAKAADELQGEDKSLAYAFGDYEERHYKLMKENWESKGVIPIMYRRKGDDPSLLHDTLAEWGGIYRDGVFGKEKIITTNARTAPVVTPSEDHTIRLVLWALTNEAAADKFARLNPVPPLEWLKPLSEGYLGHKDLIRFGVTPNKQVNADLHFSYINRPSPYMRSPRMCLVNSGIFMPNHDRVMNALCYWFTRHLGDPNLVLWVINQGCVLDSNLKEWVHRRLYEIAEWEAKDDAKRIKEEKQHAPQCMPNSVLRVLWRLLVDDRVKSIGTDVDIYAWISEAHSTGLNESLRYRFLQFLKPLVILRQPMMFWRERSDQSSPSVRDYVDWDISLAADYVHGVYDRLKEVRGWEEFLSASLWDLTLLMLDALRLMAALGGADERRDLSSVHRPSIEPHEQNRYINEWTILIDLVRDSWEVTMRTDSSRARRIADEWWKLGFPLFKRMALYAASQDEIISPRVAVNWLVSERAWWLWSVETTRETIHVLKRLAPIIRDESLGGLEQAILEGPPRNMFFDELTSGEFARLSDREVWLRLSMMTQAGAEWKKSTRNRLTTLTEKYPNWILSKSDRDEFHVWIGDENVEWPAGKSTPPQIADLVSYLSENENPPKPHGDDWEDRCRKEPKQAIMALTQLATQGKWPVNRWRTALQVWADPNVNAKTWPEVGKVIHNAPEHVLLSILATLSWWLKNQAKLIDAEDELFYALTTAVLSLGMYAEQQSTQDALMDALNHPIGHATQAILDFWRARVRGGGFLSDEDKRLLAGLCDLEFQQYIYGRVLIAAYVLYLLRDDKEWTRVTVLPLFNWENPIHEVEAVWAGLLWSTRPDREIIFEIKKPLLEVAEHLTRFTPERMESYAAFMTVAALEIHDVFTKRELRILLETMPKEALPYVILSLQRMIEGAGSKKAGYWQNRVLPFIEQAWPKSRDRVSSGIAERFAHLCLSTEESFYSAVSAVKHYMMPLQRPGALIGRLSEQGLCRNQPEAALEFLSTIIGEETLWVTSGFAQCLNDIAVAEPRLAEDRRFVRIRDLSRRKGWG